MQAGATIPSLTDAELIAARRLTDNPITRRDAFAQSVIRGLSAQPRWLNCSYLYDARGSALFDQITELPEYYLTRAETQILERHSERIRALVGPAVLAELGAGSAVKTRLLLDAWMARGRTTYVPIDISSEHLAAVSSNLRRQLPDLGVHEIAATYEQALTQLAAHSPLCLLFLGSSIGNFNPQQTEQLLTAVAASLAAGDHFLLGVDLVKDIGVIERAYDDSAGVTAAFIRNLFGRMNRELGAAIDLDAIEHVAYYNQACRQVEIYARFRRTTEIALPEYGRSFRIGPGEMVWVEISRKFELADPGLSPQRYGFRAVETLTDPEQRFALLLWQRQSRPQQSRRSKALADLAAVRANTLRMVEPLTDQQLTGQHSSLLSPIVWDLGHIANYEEQWVSRAVCGGRRLDHNASRNDGLYDAVRHPRVRRAELALLDRTGAISFLDSIRSQTRSAMIQLEGAAPSSPDNALLADAYVFALLAQHEAQHSETILQSIQLIEKLEYEPFWRRSAAGLGRATGVEVLVPGGAFVMGTDDRSRAYDNERPARLVDLPAYFIDALPVSNGEFLAFIEADGYRRPELWSEGGREWLALSAAQHPQQWRRSADGEWSERHFGRLEPLRLTQPVVHVSWFEAEAYARWAGKRLPSEAEWEKAAAWDLERGVARVYPWGDRAPTAALCNLGFELLAPVDLGTLPQGASYYGCEQMLGDVWEWTASEFLPYPGFEMFPYPEYSSIHFGKGFRVLRGGSWATNPIAIRNSFRNWDLPQRRQLFAGFRCARSAE